MTSRRSTLAAAALLAALTGAWSSPRHLPGEEIAYPTGYRLWTHVKSEIIGPEHPAFPRFGGIHHVYANQPAMTGYRAGRFPQGSVIVFDVLQAEQRDGRTFGTRRRVVDVMVKDSIRFGATGGWGFEEFRGDSRTERSAPELMRGCAGCHQRAPHDMVFSDFPD
jgi:hypothetical protein